MLKKPSIWFWQQIFTPHMGALSATLANRGFRVFFVANKRLSKERAQLGWETPTLGKGKFILAPNKNRVKQIALKVPKNSIHFSGGLHGNGLIKNAQYVLRARGLKHWVMMETVDDSRWHGPIKRVLYRLLFLWWRNHIEGILAIGQNTFSWIVARGMKQSRVYPFAYFLKDLKKNQLLKKFKKKENNIPFRFIFVGNLIKRKRVDQLINALAVLSLKKVELWIVGSGPEEKYLRSLADFLIPKKVKWFGVVSMHKVPNLINQSDCLVLPSRFDGWGAVVTESLMVGTPVICSNACGASITVKASGVGSIFPANSQKALINCLRKQYKKKKLNFKNRKKIIKWAKCLGANSGAEYIELLITTPKKKLLKNKIFKDHK
ncbi:glycosyltransferase family 4 protein [Candidatus Pelagibacter sp.]|jgi:glycosyltransferase involved in cell wall biosynthesis|nr:glycosyltransferase family 4 protein [Candidatus Pelagibacter sp.]